MIRFKRRDALGGPLRKIGQAPARSAQRVQSRAPAVAGRRGAPLRRGTPGGGAVRSWALSKTSSVASSRRTGPIRSRPETRVRADPAAAPGGAPPVDLYHPGAVLRAGAHRRSAQHARADHHRPARGFRASVNRCRRRSPSGSSADSCSRCSYIFGRMYLGYSSDNRAPMGEFARARGGPAPRPSAGSGDAGAASRGPTPTGRLPDMDRAPSSLRLARLDGSLAGCLRCRRPHRRPSSWLTCVRLWRRRRRPVDEHRRSRPPSTRPRKLLTGASCMRPGRYVRGFANHPRASGTARS